jgi:phage head maturation protease
LPLWTSWARTRGARSSADIYSTSRSSADIIRRPYALQLVPTMRAGQLGSSFRFRVLREQRDDRPPRSHHNPERLPERTIREATVFELGPVTFPAYAWITAGVRHRVGQ